MFKAAKALMLIALGIGIGYTMDAVRDLRDQMKEEGNYDPDTSGEDGPADTDV